MKAKFVGDPNDDFSGPKVLKFSPNSKPTEVLAFPKDVFVPVTDEQALALMGHNHFTVEEGDAPEYVAPEPPAPRAEATEDAATASAGGLSKAEIMDRLTAMGVEFDARLGAPKLRSILETAEFEQGDD